MKLLFISQGVTVDDQRSYAAALSRACVGGAPLEVVNIPFLGVLRTQGWEALWWQIVECAKAFMPDIVFFQFFHGFDDRGADPTACLDGLCALKPKPLIFASLGDPYGFNFPFRRIPNRVLMSIARRGDAFFTTSLGELGEYLAANGVKNIVFLPHAHDDANFVTGGLGQDFDVAMVGSCLVTLRPHMLPWTLGNSLRRKYVARLLWKRYGKRFGLFGNGWRGYPCWQGPIGFRDQVRLFRSCRCVVDAPAPVTADYYASDRPFYIAGSGSPLVMQRIRGFERIFQDGVSAFYFDRLSEVTQACDRALSLDKSTRMRNQAETAKIVNGRQTFDQRVDTILSVAEALKANDVRLIRPWHFNGDFGKMSVEELGVVNWTRIVK